MFAKFFLLAVLAATHIFMLVYKLKDVQIWQASARLGTLQLLAPHQRVYGVTFQWNIGIGIAWLQMTPVMAFPSAHAHC